MSSQFAARSNGVCALSGKSFAKGEMVMFLVRRGTDERAIGGPEGQIVTSKKEDGYETGFRSVPAGTVTTGNGRYRRTRTVFAVEQLMAGGRWVRVSVWSQVVIVAEARAAGYNVSGRTVIAHKGKRTVGHEHSLDKASIASVGFADLTQPKIAPAPEMIETETKPEGLRVLDLDAAPTLEDVAAAFAAWNEPEAKPVEVCERARVLDLD